MSEPQSIEEFDLGVPQKGAKDGYLIAFFNNRMQMANTILQMQGITDFKVEIMTLFMISGITDENDRNIIWNHFEDTINKIRDGGGDMDEKGRKIAQECMKTQGKVSSWYDKHMGITHRLSIGIGGKPFWLQPGGEDYVEPSKDSGKS